MDCAHQSLNPNTSQLLKNHGGARTSTRLLGRYYGLTNTSPNLPLLVLISNTVGCCHHERNTLHFPMVCFVLFCSYCLIKGSLQLLDPFCCCHALKMTPGKRKPWIRRKMIGQALWMSVLSSFTQILSLLEQLVCVFLILECVLK